MPRINGPNPTIEDARTFDLFIEETRALLEGTAKDKGYNQTGVDGENELYSFIQSLSHSDSHAIGEIIYKIVRYNNLGDRRDLVKVAAWSYLVWKFGVKK